MANLVLRLDGVSKSYPGVRALDRVTLDCRAGEVHAILGENGSGKSTLMKIASGVVRPDTGTVEIGGTVLPQSDARIAASLGLATVYQDDSLVLELTVAQNLFLATPPHSRRFGDMRRAAEQHLAALGLDLSPDALLADMTPAQRQFVEIAKAVQSRPKVLLLDEPTATLDAEGVKKLTALIRDLTASGTGIIYVSHRLPEILDLADRISVLRDGVHCGTHEVTPGLSEHDLVSLMVGRDIDSEYMPKLPIRYDRTVLQVEGLSGTGFHDIRLTAHVGEILGIAGAEGNGQREMLRAIVGLEESTGSVSCQGRSVDIRSPRAALGGGVLFLSSDRKGEAIFPQLSVQKNMTASMLDQLSRGGVLSAGAEENLARAMKADFGVVSAGLDVPVNGLSGGNQQKTVLARSFRAGAKAILIDEPTQGVDAGARFEIYRTIRENIAEDGTCIVNSSDAQELAGICDRVLVMSRGRIVRELTGAEISEEAIVSSFLTVRDLSQTQHARPAAEAVSLLRTLTNGSAVWWVPILFLAILIFAVGVYAASASPVFLKAINIRHTLLALAPAALVAMAQLHVLLVRGIDVSVGAAMSLVVVTASFLIGSGATTPGILLGVLLCLGLGTVLGLANGLIIRFGGINAVITTIATLSIVQGAALLARPIPGGVISNSLTEALKARIGFVPLSALLVVAFALLGDFWLHRTNAGLETKATGFREEAARRNGVRITWIHLRAYLVCGLMAALAGLFLGAQVAVGHPTVGQNFALASIAAAVLGGASLAGGRGSFSGTLLGALFFTLMVNVLSLLGLSASVGVIASGIMTLTAIFLYSGLSELQHLWRRALRPSPQSRAQKGIDT
jgi:ribose transport system ATP-binding protein